MPECKSKADQKIDDQHAKEQTLAETACIEGEGGEENDPDDIGRSRPGIMWPFVFIASNVAKRNPREVSASEEARHAPQRSPAHEMAGTIR